MKDNPMTSCIRLVLTVTACLGFAAAASGATKQELRAACVPLVKDAVQRTLAKSSRYLTAADAAIINNCASVVDIFTVEAPAPVVPQPQPAPSPAVGLDEARAIVTGMAPGEFRAVSRNTMQSVAPPCGAGQSYCAVQGPVAVMNSWGGGTFDTRRNDLIIIGGGHNDYAGNEVYRFSLKTLRWERATDPSPLSAVDATGQVTVTDGSQAPVSFHSYDGIVYVPSVDHVFALPQASYKSGNSYDGFAYLWDPATKAWQRGQVAPVNVTADRGCDFDAASNEVVCTQPNGRMAYSIATRSWRLVSNFDDQDFGRTSAIDQSRRLFCSVWKQTKPLACYDLADNSGQQVRKAPAFAGNTGFAQSGNSGLAWRPRDGRFYAYPGCNEVYAVKPGALTDTWTSVRYASPTGPACDPNQIGIYGKWQYVPDLDVFVFVRAWNEPVYFWKPNEGPGDTANTTPSMLPSAMVATLQDGQTIDLPKGEFVDCLVVRASNVTIRGYGTTLRSKACEGGVATAITRGANVRIEGLTVRDAQGDAATSCFGVMAGSAVLDRVDAEGCGQGLRTGRGAIDLTVIDSRFGPTRPAGQLQHNWYVDRIDRVTARGVSLIGCASGGHVLKSRAKVTIFDAGTIAQLGHTCSAPVDTPNAGEVRISGSVIEQGTYADISPVLINYGREVGIFDDVTELPGGLFLEGNTLISDYVSPDGRVGPRGAQLAVLVLGPGKNTARVVGNRIVHRGPPMQMVLTWADRTPERIVENTGNAWFVGRVAAGLPDYPALR